MPQETTNNSIYLLIAAIHGITGLIIFLAGLTQFTLKKQGKIHRIIGRVYLYSWIVILATGFYIGSPIIVAIVVMGFYLCVTGIRFAILKGRPHTGFDKGIIGCAALIVLFMIYSAIVLLIRQQYTYAILAVFFSLLYGLVITLDALTYLFGKSIFRKKYGKMSWYVSHLNRMQLSFLTAVGAFTAVQDLFGNTVLNFILPAVIGFFIVRGSKAYFVKKLKLAEQVI
jgi:hypothetical protein